MTDIIEEVSRFSRLKTQLQELVCVQEILSFFHLPHELPIYDYLVDPTLLEPNKTNG